MDLPFCPEVGVIKESLSMPWIHPGEIIWLGLKNVLRKRAEHKKNCGGKISQVMAPYFFYKSDPHQLGKVP